jgi:hypothetical protein
MWLTLEKLPTALRVKMSGSPLEPVAQCITVLHWILCRQMNSLHFVNAIVPPMPWSPEVFFHFNFEIQGLYPSFSSSSVPQIQLIPSLLITGEFRNMPGFRALLPNPRAGGAFLCWMSETAYATAYATCGRKAGSRTEVALRLDADCYVNRLHTNRCTS